MDGPSGGIIDANTTMSNLTKTREKLNSLSQGNLEAIMQSSQIWTAGCQAISKTMAARTQANLDQTMATWKALFGVRSFKDAMDFRTSLMHTSFEAALAEVGKMADASVRLAEQTMAPINERIAAAAETFRQPMM